MKEKIIIKGSYKGKREKWRMWVIYKEEIKRIREE